MRKLLFLFLVFYSLFLIPVCVEGQKEIKRTWNWYFGEYAALNFSNGSPVAITNSAMYALDDACSSISDTLGNLLCYTNGAIVYDRSNSVMPNGTGLYQYTDGPGTMIVPQPMNDSLLYIFTTDTNGFWYSIVNMKQNGGLGDVVSKNNSLFSEIASLKVAGTYSANDTDIWVLGMKLFTDSFYTFRLTPKGLNTKPIISKCGRADSIGAGQIKFSSSGQKLALAIENYEGIEVLRFNDTTGIVYSNQPIDMPFCGYNNCNVEGVEFSPDESKIYWLYENNPGKYLYQMNLAAGSNSAILASATFIDSLNTPSNSGGGGLQLGTDGKIYCAKVQDTVLGVITKPDSQGTLCGYVDNGVSLGGKTCYYGLPNFVSSYFYNKSIGTSVPEIVTNTSVTVYPNPSKGVFNFQIATGQQLMANSRIEVYNVLGESVIPIQVANNSQFVIDLSSQPDGVYFYKLISKEGFVSEGKLIKE